MTDFYRNKNGDKILAVEKDVVEEYTMLSTTENRIVVGYNFDKDSSRETVVAIEGEELKKDQLVVELKPHDEENEDDDDEDEDDTEEEREVSPLNRPLKYSVTPVDDPVEERRKVNQDLQQRYGTTSINAIIRMRENGATLEEIIEKRPFGTKGMLETDIEQIMDNWTELEN